MDAHAHDDHDHDRHGHGHHHAPASFGTAFLIGTLLNLGFVGVEALYGIWSNSIALLADAGHNLSDVLGLLIAWGAMALSRAKPTPRFSYGLRRSSILAALFNAVFLLIAIGAIGFEAIQRFFHPAPVAGGTVMAVGAIGILVNGITAWLFARGRAHDINIRGAYLHMAADAAVSAGVVVSGFIVLMTGWEWVDPLTSLTVVAVILVGTWGLLRDSVVMSLDAVPTHIEPDEVSEALAALPGVARVHDLHIWPMSTTEVALTCHLAMPGGFPGTGFLHSTSAMLEKRFAIHHSTLQIEVEDEPCAQSPTSCL
ncbi:MAG: cation diffusion facilitator family transporter [Sphingomicrobium sp.]